MAHSGAGPNGNFHGKGQVVGGGLDGDHAFGDCSSRRPRRATSRNPCRMRGNPIYRSGPGLPPATTWSVQPEQSVSRLAIVRQRAWPTDWTVATLLRASTFMKESPARLQHVSPYSLTRYRDEVEYLVDCHGEIDPLGGNRDSRRCVCLRPHCMRAEDNSNQSPALIDQRAARISGVDGRLCLDHRDSGRAGRASKAKAGSNGTYDSR